MKSATVAEGPSLPRSYFARETVAALAVCGVVVLWIALRADATSAALVAFFTTLFLLIRASNPRALSWAQPSIGGTFVAAYTAMMAIPACFIAQDLVRSTAWTYLLAINSVFVTFALGIVVGARLWSRGTTTAGRASSVQQDARLWRLCLFLLLPSVVIVALYFAWAPQIQLLTLFDPAASTGGVDGTSLRFAANELPPVLHLGFEIVRRAIIPLVVSFLYLLKLSDPDRWSKRFVLAFVSGTFVMLLTLDRAPVVALLVMLAMARLFGLGENSSRVAYRGVTLLFILVGMLAAGVISVYQYLSEFSWQLALENAWYVFSYRVLQDPAYMASLAFERYDATNFLRGEYVRLLAPLTGNYVSSTGAGFEGLVDPVTFVGDLWRNWGWAGVLAGPTALGLFVSKLDLMLRNHTGAAASSLRIVAMVQAVWLIPGHFFGVVSSVGFALTLLIVWWVMSPPLGGARQPALSVKTSLHEY